MHHLQKGAKHISAPPIYVLGVNELCMKAGRGQHGQLSFSLTYHYASSNKTNVHKDK